MDETQQYSAAEMERMMKVQDVLLKAMAKKITWWAAAEIIGVTDRTMRRWRERLETDGYSGLADRRKGKPSAQADSAGDGGEGAGTVQGDLLRPEHPALPRKAARGARNRVELHLGAEGAARSRSGGQAAQARAAPAAAGAAVMPGMLLHIDGSKHQWLSDDRWYDLIVILDDATSEIYYAQLVEEESTRTVMAGLREVIEKQGLFCALYSDRGSHFFVTLKEGEKVDKHRLTQVGRAMKELGVQMIPAYSPQARGRSERSFGTWQGRLPQELRLAGITHGGGCQSIPARAIHRRIQRQVPRGGGGERDRVSAHGEERPELDLHGTNGTGGG